jgi:hypothetical protein
MVFFFFFFSNLYLLLIFLGATEQIKLKLYILCLLFAQVPLVKCGLMLKWCLESFVSM